MADYYVDYDGNISTKKKKKKQSSSADYVVDYNGKISTNYTTVDEEEKDSALQWRNDEVAPTQERTWFQKSKGNFLETVGGTVTDVAENAIESRAGFWERFIDGLSMLGTAMNQGSMMQAANSEITYNLISGNDESASNVLNRYQNAQDEAEKATMDFVAKDLINEQKVAKQIIDPVEEKLGLDTEGAYSVLGEKSDELVQSGVDVLARQGIGKIPVVGQALSLVTTGASVLGGEAENAARQGATYEDAFLSGMISAGAEIGVEQLTGGIKFGGKTLTDGVGKKIASVMSNKAVATLAKWGFNTVGEGAEEDLTGYISALGQKFTYASDKELEEIYSSEDHWENFFGGAILGGFFEGVNIASAKKNNIDYVTDLSKSERQVVDKVYNDAIAEAQQNGKKLTSREKTKIFDKVIADAEKGYISTDTIEEVLGGDDYKAYKEISTFTEGLSKEAKEIGSKTNPTLAEQYKYSSLMDRLKESNAKKDSARAKLDATMSGLIQNSHLAESYNEVARKGQAFEVDLSQYEGAQRTAVERAVKSGVLNNTNRSHELVNVLSKIEADKGIVFNYADNAKLKESGFAIDGKTVNGFVKDGEVTLNVQSPKAWQSTVGHEITHILEGTDSYSELQSALFAYAESKGELESKRATLTELYKGMDADIDAELTADLVGDYLFSDNNFIKGLTTNKTLFQKIYDEIKYLCKVATGKELTEIEKVRREFDNAWKELSTKGTSEEINETADVGTENVKYSIREEAPPKKTIKGYKVFKVVDGKLYPPMVDNPSGNGTPVGVWLNADVGGLAYNKDGTVKLNNNGRFAVESSQGGTLAFRPGWHLGEYPDASQFGRVDTSHPLAEEELTTYKGKTYKNKKDGNTYPMNLFPYNFVWAECEVAADHDYQLDAMALGVNKNGSFVRTQAGLPYVPTDGYYKYRTNADPNTAPWIISGAIKVNRILDDAEVAEICAQHGVTPQTREGYTNLKKKDGGSRTPGNAINLADFGLEKGEVAPTDAAILAEIYKSDDVAKAQSKTAMDLLKTLPGYAKRKINFADENIIKEFGMNNQDVEYYRNLAETTNDGYLADDNLYSERKPIISKLTDREISEQSYSALDRLGRGEAVALEELDALPEILEGKEKVKEYRNEFLTAHPELKDVPSGELGTYLINSAEREQLRKNILEERLKSGSFTHLDKKGKEVYNGSVEKGKRLDIVIGLPAAGKSTSIVNPLSQYYKSVVVDSDIIKQQLPEFNEGWGASLVHEESSEINMRMLGKELALGNNIVLPIVGSKTSSVEKYLNLAKEKGYAIHIHLNELSSSKAMGRMIGRYFKDGRFIPPSVSYKYGDLPTTVYEEIKNRGDISGYSHWNNDVAKGQRPILAGISGNNELYGEYSNSWRAVRATDVGENDRGSQTGKSEDFGNGVGGLQGHLATDGTGRGQNSEGSTGLSPLVRLSLSPVTLNPKTQEALSRSGVVSLELIDSSDDSNAFSIALSEARTADGANGWAVTPKTAEELVENNVRTVMTSDKNAGLGVAPDGDIEAVFKNPNGGQSRVLDTLIPAALEMGGNKLDCYGTGLVRLYSKYGFVPVARLTFNPKYANEGWTPDKGKLDIFFMVHNGDSADVVVANKGKYKQWTTEELNALPLYDKEAYDDAYAYRDSLLPENIAPVKNSLSFNGEQSSTGTPLQDLYFAPTSEYIAPVVAENATVDKIPTPTDNAPFPDEIAPMTEEEANALQDEKAQADANAEGEPKTRKQLHNNIITKIKSVFSGKGFDFDEVLKKAKDLSTFSTVDNTPQRVMEKALGYKEGQALADLTVNKVAQNETEGIKWLNSFTDNKNGLLAKLSKQYRIKPGSKESAAAQMYAEGFYVNKNGDIIEYGDAELAKDFPNEFTQTCIKGLAKDPRIRQVYDETLKAINESRTRNAYPEIQRLDNYFLHFRAMEDTFSKIGLPFNPNDIRAKDLPTDLNGVTADLKPGQPYFASAMHRKGQRTSFDLLGGLERYLTSAKNQIYHIDDIQTLRALRNYIADNYGQANGLEGLDALSEEEQQERIEQVFGSHLSTFAKFLNEEANVIAGKTALIDRGLEGVIGRRGMTFMDSIRKQVGSNMIGFNVSSSLTNFLAGVQAIAKTNKAACVKSLAQTASSRVQSIFGKTDDFVENNPTIIRRKGAERFYRTPFQKVGDAGYVLMSAVDDVTTEFIVRAKYNEFIKKGMSEEQAITEADKWTSRLMGDRSLGQMPQIYNSKTLGLITQFQLEVRNQLDSQFYDTIQEAKVSNEDIQNGLVKNAKTAAKVTKTFFELAVLQHLFGVGFEAVAGYNPAFDIIGVLATALGFDDDEESEDTALDNIEQGFLELLEDLPYTSVITNGGRIPISNALPIQELITGKDDYGNEKSRLEIIGETAPYYVLPGGYGQIKKTYQGLSMFNTDEEHPVAGSYTDSGNLRFPVDDTVGNRIQAGIFGQYANENAREYFDNEYAPLKEKQIQEYMDADMPIADYWKYREGLNDLEPLEGEKSVSVGQKADYIDSLDIQDWQKNLLMNNILDRKQDVDMTNYSDYNSWEEFDYAQKNPEKYAFAKSVGGYSAYKTYSEELYDIKADKDSNGKSISGSRKEKVINYINNLNADYYTKIILYKSEYPSDDTYNYEIINYLNGRADMTYNELISIYTELGFTVKDGYVYWD